MAKSTAVERRLIGLFWLMVALCLLPFVLLAFLNDMAADDFLYCSLFRQSGFFGGQQLIYLRWAGRFTTNFLNASFAASGLLAHFYWLPCLLLFAFTGWAIFFLVRTIYSLLPDKPAGRAGSWIAVVSFILFILLLYVQADIGTGFYWFSSAIVYQSSMILFLLMTASLLKRFTRSGPAPGHDALLLLLILLIGGCNEMAAVLLVFLLVAVIGGYGYIRRRIPAYLWVYLGTAVLAGLILILTSGVLRVRSAMMNSHNSYLNILAATGFQFVYVFFSVFKEPLFWLSGIAAFLAGDRLSRKGMAVGWLAAFRETDLFFKGLIVLCLLIGLSLATVMTGSRGSLPPRVLNNLTGLLAIGLLMLLVVAGIRRGGRTVAAEGFPLSPAALSVMLALPLLASTNYRDAWKTVLSGYFRHAVFQDRARQLTDAGERHQRVVTIRSYPDAIEDKIRERLPHGLPETLRTYMLEKPPLMYPYDGTAAQNQKGYCQYYGIDSIIVGGH